MNYTGILFRKTLAENEVPHTTLNDSAEGKAINTRHFDFEPHTPWYIGDSYGGFEKGKIFFK